MTNENMRDEFEAFGKRNEWNMNRRDMSGADGSYCNSAVETAWQAWQAAAAHSAARIAEKDAEISSLLGFVSKLEGQVAMLRDALRHFAAEDCDCDSCQNALKVISATAQTAEQYKRRVKSEAKIGLLRDMIEDLRGTDCAYYPMDLQAIIHTIEDDELRQAEGKGEK